MFKKFLIVLALFALSLFGLQGCQKEGGGEPVKSKADYQAEAQKDITAENMEEALENIEKSISEEISSEE